MHEWGYTVLAFKGGGNKAVSASADAPGKDHLLQLYLYTENCSLGNEGLEEVTYLWSTLCGEVPKHLTW